MVSSKSLVAVLGALATTVWLACTCAPPVPTVVPVDAGPGVTDSQIVRSADSDMKALVVTVYRFPHHPVVVFAGMFFKESAQEVAVQTAAALADPEAKEVTIVMASTGGRVNDTIVSAGFIRQQARHKKVMCVGMNVVASSAFYFFQAACDDRALLPQTRMITHRLVTPLAAGVYSAEQLLAFASIQIESQNFFDEKIAERMGMDLLEYKSHIAGGDWVMDPATAIKNHAADRVLNGPEDVVWVPEGLLTPVDGGA